MSLTPAWRAQSLVRSAVRNAAWVAMVAAIANACSDATGDEVGNPGPGFLGLAERPPNGVYFVTVAQGGARAVATSSGGRATGGARSTGGYR